MVFDVENNYPSVSQIPASMIPLVFHTPNNYPGVFPTSASGDIGFSYFRGNFRPAEAECRHFRVTVVTSGRRRPPCRAVPCRAVLGLQCGDNCAVPRCAWSWEWDHCAVPAPCPRATAVSLALVSGRFREKANHRRGARFALEGENK